MLQRKKTTKFSQRGFTLIELLVVLSIIGLLASIVISATNSARLRARDGSRKASLSQLQKALELYAQNNSGAYPNSISNNWVSSETGDLVTVDTVNYIPGLVPTYVAKLPRDPLGGNGQSIAACSGGWKRAYAYISDGTDYKLVSNCSVEVVPQTSDTFIDPNRDGGPTGITCDGAGDKTVIWAFAVYSSNRSRCW